jgi:hypothetical protein
MMAVFTRGCTGLSRTGNGLWDAGRNSAKRRSSDAWICWRSAWKDYILTFVRFEGVPKTNNFGE